MTGWVDIQQHLVRKYDLIAEIEAETITFTRLGGYNARPYSFELDILNGLSAKSLKGVLRWWSRAAVVGALGGTIDYAEANKYLKQIYGGVRRREGEKTTASKIQLTVETIFPQSSEQRAKDAQNIHQKHHESRDQLPPRMRLLLLAGGQRDKEERKTLETKNIKFKIQLLGERNPRLCNFVMASLLMTLILGGVGSMTRRGFGSLKPSS
ncbi:MAG: type III-B CRISPR module RAMP protein Cmr1, partial [Candidatus Caldarchaeum sp.]